MNLIETKQSLQSFLKSNVDIKLIVPIWSYHKAHVWQNRISFIYYKTNDSDGIINSNHIDAKKLDCKDVLKLINENTLVLDNRYLNTIGFDYEWVYFEQYGKPFILSDFAESLYRGYRTDFKELNDCIPLMKWYEVLKGLPIPPTNIPSYRKYSNAITTLGRLEGAGVKVVREKFIDAFPTFPEDYMRRDNIVYTQYNPYTITGRPSNRHLGVNWAALNKSDGSRDVMVSRFPGGTLLQFDYESYHIRLIAKLIKYEFPIGMSAHEHLAQMYGVGVEESKGITFRYLYGGLDEFAREIPFFQKVDDYIKEIYQKFVISGRLTTPLYGREIHFGRIEGATEQKVFNYLLQSLETEINYMKIGEVMEWLNGKMSKMILYTYDAFLIDTHPTERDSVLEGVKGIMERGGFPVKGYEGKNYGSLELLS